MRGRERPVRERAKSSSSGLSGSSEKPPPPRATIWRGRGVVPIRSSPLSIVRQRRSSDKPLAPGRRSADTDEQTLSATRGGGDRGRSFIVGLMPARPGYRVEAFLGSGYYAHVFRVVELGTGRSYAAKIYAGDSPGVEATAREAEALRALPHQRVPALRQTFDQGGWPIVGMELVPSRKLRD